MTNYAECHIIMRPHETENVSKAFCRTHGVFLTEIGCQGSLWNRLLGLERRLDRLEAYVQAEVPQTGKSAELFKAMGSGKK